MSYLAFFLFECCLFYSLFFFFNDTATTEIYTLSLHDALPILVPSAHRPGTILPSGEPTRQGGLSIWRSLAIRARKATQARAFTDTGRSGKKLAPESRIWNQRPGQSVPRRRVPAFFPQLF